MDNHRENNEPLYYNAIYGNEQTYLGVIIQVMET